MNKLIIGISGRVGSGKTTLAKNLKNYFKNCQKKCEEVNFADPLKKLVLEYFVPSDWKLSLDCLQDQAVKNKILPCGKSIRKVLQLVGTDYFRRIDPDIWIRLYKQSVQQSSADVIITSDVRFINELQAINAFEGVAIRLTRYMEKSKHPSERDLDLAEFAVIHGFLPRDIRSFFAHPVKYLQWCRNPVCFDIVIDNTQYDARATYHHAIWALKSLNKI